jgi:carbonic anhydrase
MMKATLSVIAALALSACAVKTKHGETPAAPAATPQAAAPQAAAEPYIEPVKIESSQHEHHVSTHVPKGVAPETSLRWLANGNTRFVKKYWRKDGAAKADIHRLSTGQQPHAVVLSCSDSRVPPEIVFDQKLGEVFTIRTAGQALDHNAIGSIEYAAEHLGSRLIVVMGHTSCGAVEAAHGTLDGSSAGSPSLNALVGDIHPRIMAFKGHAISDGAEKESWANAVGVANDLLARSAILASMEARGHIEVVPALYNLKNGHVTFRHDFKPDVRTPATAH